VSPKIDHLYENDEPIDDELVVLDLMSPGWNDGTTRSISLWPHAPSHVAIDHFSGGYDRHSGTTRFLITERVHKSLLADRYIAGTPQWGYTCMRELRITPRGEEKYWNRWKELKDAGSEMPRASCWLRRRRT
jgi:hypothetical protein